MSCFHGYKHYVLELPRHWPKRKELELYLKENNFHMVALNETFLKKIDFKIQGYDTIKMIIEMVPEMELPSS